MAAHKRAELTATRVRDADGPGVILPSEVTASRAQTPQHAVPLLPAGILNPGHRPHAADATPWRLDTVRIDAKGRIPTKATAELLGWSTGHTVSGEADADSGLVTLSDEEVPEHRQVAARVDGKGRLLLDAGVRAALAVPGGGQVVVFTHPADRTVHLVGAGVVVAALASEVAGTQLAPVTRLRGEGAA